MARRFVRFVDASGVPVTGLTPTITWIYTDGSAVGGGIPAVAQLSASEAPGVYWYDPAPEPSGGKDIAVTVASGGAPESAFHIITPDDFALTEARLAQLDSPIPDQVWDALATTLTTTGSIGLLMRILIGTAGRVNEVADTPSYDGQGKLVSATRRLYPTKADAKAKTNQFAELTLTVNRSAGAIVDTESVLEP